MLPMKKNSQYLVVNCSKLSRRSRSRRVTRTSCLSWDGSQSAPNVLISLITHKRWRINHRANSTMPWHGAPRRQGLPVWMHYGIGSGVRYYAVRLMSTYSVCFAVLTVHDEKMHWTRHLQFMMIWSNIGVLGLYGAPAPTVFGTGPTTSFIRPCPQTVHDTDISY